MKIPTKKEICKVLGISMPTLNTKLKNPKSFKVSELEKLNELGIDTSKILYGGKNDI